MHPQIQKQTTETVGGLFLTELLLESVASSWRIAMPMKHHL
jgi:hypothetical protein